MTPGGHYGVRVLADTRWHGCIFATALLALSGCVEGGATGDASTGDAGDRIGPIMWCPALATCDDGDACTDGDRCEEGLCVGVPRVCETPPGQCYATVGACTDGECLYEPREGACDDGDPCTLDDRCSAGRCGGTPITCQAPPPPTCLADGRRRVFVESGLCAAGECVYSPVDTACPGGGCRDGVCECVPESPTGVVVDTGLVVGASRVEPSMLVQLGAVHVAYHDTARDTLRMAHRSPGGDWSHELVDGAAEAGLGSVLFAEGEDLYVAYERGPSVWWARRRVGSLEWDLPSR